MATKFMTLNEGKTKVENTTSFDKQLWNGRIEISEYTPDNFDNVLFLGNDGDYGDVFKAWNNESPEAFWIFFGEKGDEFND